MCKYSQSLWDIRIPPPGQVIERHYKGKLLIAPSDRALETNAIARRTGLQLKYSSGIVSIFEDNKGRFWFGSHKEGVCLWIGNELRYFTTKDGLSDNQIRTIQEDQAGVVWFDTGNGITSFDADGFEIRTNKERKSAILPGAKAWPTDTEGLWFHGDDATHRGFDGQGVYRYDGKTLSFLDLPVPSGVDAQNPYLVTNIAKGKNGTVWYGTYPGVFRYDGESFTVINDKTVGIHVENERLHAGRRGLWSRLLSRTTCSKTKSPNPPNEGGVHWWSVTGKYLI
jgi:ligand-binding sensor domain-containing protein